MGFVEHSPTCFLSQLRSAQLATLAITVTGCRLHIAQSNSHRHSSYMPIYSSIADELIQLNQSGRIK